MKKFKYLSALLIILLISIHSFAQITSYPHSTNFASGFGDWNQSGTDDFDWTQITSGTLSSGTGPQSSNGANGTTGYVYTETSSPITTNQTARIFCTYDLSNATAASVTFYYHIYAVNGYGPGTLRLKIYKGNSVSGGTMHYPWTVTTSYNGWQQATIDLADYVGYSYVQLAFESITPSSGTVWQCDNAIDEVVVSTTVNSGGGGSSGGTVEIGDPNSTLQNGRVPAYGYYDYSWSAAIYTAAELGGLSKTIDKISWNVTNGNSMTLNNQEIWMAHTTEEVFPDGIMPDVGNGSWSGFIKVYDGNVSFSPGWNEIILTSPFTFNGSENLLIKVINNHGSWASSYPEFQYTSKTNSVVYNYNDGSFPSSSGYRNAFRPNTRFGFGGSALPIVLVSFEGEVIGDYVELNWVVASQVNNDYYTIEKSLDAYNWEELAVLPGEGNTNTQISYTTYDENPIVGHNYYRLTQTDYDGKFESFRPIAVTLKGERKEVIKRTNLLGQPVKNSYIGIVVEIWDNGDIVKRYNRP